MNAVLEHEPTYPEIPEWDDPVWYKPDGTLWPLEFLWYSCPRIREYVVANVPKERLDRESERKNKNSALAKRWREIERGGADSFKSASVVDRLFVRLGLASFHTVLGPPEKALIPGGKPPRLTLREVLEIRARKRAGETGTALSEVYGVHKETILRLCRKPDDHVYRVYGEA